jgi:hypothetical protein
MHFRMKNILQSNRNHTPKQTRSVSCDIMDLTY